MKFLMAVENWKDAHPLLKIIPVEWKYTIHTAFCIYRTVGACKKISQSGEKSRVDHQNYARRA